MTLDSSAVHNAISTPQNQNRSRALVRLRLIATLWALPVFVPSLSGQLADEPETIRRPEFWIAVALWLCLSVCLFARFDIARRIVLLILLVSLTGQLFLLGMFLLPPPASAEQPIEPLSASAKAWHVTVSGLNILAHIWMIEALHSRKTIALMKPKRSLLPGATG